MSHDALPFLVALVVNVAVLVFVNVYSYAVSESLCRMFDSMTLEDLKIQSTPFELPLDKHPRLALARVRQAMDVSTNLPAGALTAFAFMFDRTGEGLWTIAGLALFVYALVCIYFAQSRLALAYVHKWSRWGISPLGAFLIAANLVGLLIA